jgi:hypothetical protein
MKTPKIKFVRLPKNWDESPKGCYSPHPQSRAICQLPADGHSVHKRKHPNGLQLECWQTLEEEDAHLEEIDFRNLDPIEMIGRIKAFGRPNLEPLIRLIARGHAFDKSNHQARIAIADGEREAESLIGKERS